MQCKSCKSYSTELKNVRFDENGRWWIYDCNHCDKVSEYEAMEFHDEDDSDVDEDLINNGYVDCPKCGQTAFYYAGKFQLSDGGGHYDDVWTCDYCQYTET